MQIPCETHLINQCFNSEFVEFVWKFDEPKCEYAVQFRKNGTVQVENFVSDDVSIQWELPTYTKFGPNCLCDVVDKHFNGGKSLVKLGADVVSYLNDL